MTSLYDRGMSMRREVLGNEHVDRSMGNVSEFARPVQEFVTEFVWGGVWNRDGLDLQTRSLLNLVMLTALNRMHEFGVHVRGAVNNGCSRDQIREDGLSTSGKTHDRHCLTWLYRQRDILQRGACGKACLKTGFTA